MIINDATDKRCLPVAPEMGGKQNYSPAPPELLRNGQLILIIHKLFYADQSIINIALFSHLTNKTIGFKKESKLDTNDKIMI
jgi:hypothetical protein